MFAKKWVYLLVVVGSFVWIGWKLTSRNAYESAEYSILQTDGDIELRSYPDLMLVTTDMGTQIQGDNGSFGRLFQYISGGNEVKQKVAMTTPVFMEPESDLADGQMSFVIPKSMSRSKIPRPANSSVRLTTRPAGKFAVIRFAGRFDADVLDEKRAKLESWIKSRGFVCASEPEMAGYDPPWTLGPFRRNEILIRVGS